MLLWLNLNRLPNAEAVVPISGAIFKGGGTVITWSLTGKSSSREVGL